MIAPRTLSVTGIILAIAAATLALLAGGGRASGAAVAGSALLTAAGALALAVGARLEQARMRRGLLVLILLMVGWSALGAMPLPGALMERLSPRRERIERAMPRGEQGVASWTRAVSPEGRDLTALLSEAEAQRPSLEPRLGESVATPASFAPWATRLASLVLACFLMLLLALASARREAAGLVLVGACSVLALVAALAGLVGSRMAPGLLFGRFEPHDNVGTLPYGAFWSPNHAAALLALTCPILLGCALDGQRRLALRIAALLALLPVAAALVDVGSRGGLLAGGLAALVLGAALVTTEGRRMPGAALIACAVAGLVLAFTVFSERVIDESLRETVALQGSNLERSDLYRLQARMVRESPLLGTGLGAFKTAHSAYRDEADAMLPLHGESDWMEIAAEGGIPLFLGWIVLVSALLAPALRLMFRGQAPPLLSGLGAGAVACLAHAAVDFHLREPVVAIAAVAAAATAHAWSRRLAGAGEGAATSDRWGLAFVAAAVVVTVTMAWVSMREIPRAQAFRRAEQAALAGRAEEALLHARLATEADPRHGDTWALLGWAEQLRMAGSKPGRERAERRAAVIDASVRALELSPAAFGAARRCASVLLQAGADREAADAVRLALLVAPGQGATHDVAGQLLLRQGPSDEALRHLGQAFRALPLTRIHHESRRLVAWMLDAADGDAVAALREAGPPERISWFVSELHRLGREDAARACLRALAKAPPPERAEGLAGLIVLVGGDEAVELARAILPQARNPLARQRIGMALVRGGLDAERAQGIALIREAVAAGIDSPEAWLILAEGELARQDARASEAALREGLVRHPTSPALAARLQALSSP